MSHKQAKKARKGIPHLHPNFKREQRQMFNEALAKAVQAQTKPAETKPAIRRSTVSSNHRAAMLLAMVAGMGNMR